MADSKQHDVVVIGGGPGGYVAAIRAAQNGLNAACIEQESLLGGTCLRVGCIPSKALLESSAHYREARESLGEHGVRIGKVELDLATMLKRKDQVVSANAKGVDALLKKHKIARYRGHGRLAGPGRVVITGADAQELTAKHVIIATGSKSAPLRGVEVDGEHIMTSAEALSLQKVPGHLVVIGAGYIGLELGSVWQRLGSQVTIVEYFDRILPGMDAEVAAEALKIFTKQGLEFRLGQRVTAARRDGDGCVVECEQPPPLKCDRVLLAVGRIPNTEDLGLGTVALKTDAKGRIPVDGHLKTTAQNIWAIGDVIAGPMLAHKAEEEGVAVADAIAGKYSHVNYDAIPGVVYTQPEIAAVGKTEEQLREAGTEFRKGMFQFRANGRARAIGHTEGFVKVLADAKTDRILGVHIIGAHAGDLIAEAVAAIEFGASSEDIARTSHAHPTLSEAFKEASLAVAGKAIHA